MVSVQDTPDTAPPAERRRAAANFSLLTFTFCLAVAMALMLAFRTLALSVHSVNGDGLTPLFHNGDRLLINRCSYGLRIAGNALLPYSRLMRQPVRRGDIVAFVLPDDDAKGLMVARCTAVPGDTIRTVDGPLLVPGVATCAKTDYYWMESINPQNPADSRHVGFVSERDIIGRVVAILYNHNNLQLQ